MLTPRQLLAERIMKAAAKKREAAEALVAVRDAGKGPLFSEAQMGILAAVRKQKGADPAEFVAECTAKIRPTLPSKATGEELLVFIEKAVGKIQEQNRPKPFFSQEDSETMPKLSWGCGSSIDRVLKRVTNVCRIHRMDDVLVRKEQMLYCRGKCVIRFNVGETFKFSTA